MRFYHRFQKTALTIANGVASAVSWWATMTKERAYKMDCESSHFVSPAITVPPRPHPAKTVTHTFFCGKMYE